MLGELSEIVNPAYLKLNPLEASGMDIGYYHPEMKIPQQRSEEYVDTTAFNVIILILELSSHVSVL